MKCSVLVGPCPDRAEIKTLATLVMHSRWGLFAIHIASIYGRSKRVAPDPPLGRHGRHVHVPNDPYSGLLTLRIIEVSILTYVFIYVTHTHFFFYSLCKHTYIHIQYTYIYIYIHTHTQSMITPPNKSFDPWNFRALFRILWQEIRISQLQRRPDWGVSLVTPPATAGNFMEIQSCDHMSYGQYSWLITINRG